MTKYCFILTAIISLLCAQAHAQTNRLIKNGNQLYQEGKFDKAAKDYQKALQKNPTNPASLYNLGNALYQQKQYDASRKVMGLAAKAEKNKEGKSQIDYNVGNSYMAQKKWEDAINAYKKTLINNPQDADAKYNLSYAEQMLKKQQQQGGGKNNKQNKDKDKQNQQQQNKNQQNKDQNKNGKDKNNQNKDQNKQDQNDQNQQNNNQDQNKNQQNQPQSGQPSKLSKQQADQLLDALQQEEKKLHDKLNKQKGVPVKMQKDW